MTDGALTRVSTSISESGIQVSCQRIAMLLSMHTAYELLPKLGKVWTLCCLDYVAQFSIVSLMLIPTISSIPNLAHVGYRLLPWMFTCQ